MDVIVASSLRWPFALPWPFLAMVCDPPSLAPDWPDAWARCCQDAVQGGVPLGCCRSLLALGSRRDPFNTFASAVRRCTATRVAPVIACRSPDQLLRHVQHFPDGIRVCHPWALSPHRGLAPVRGDPRMDEIPHGSSGMPLAPFGPVRAGWRPRPFRAKVFKRRRRHPVSVHERHSFAHLQISPGTPEVGYAANYPCADRYAIFFSLSAC